MTNTNDDKAKRDHARKMARIRNLSAEIMEAARKTGKVDIRAAMADKDRLGALATLEADGWLMRNGAIDHRGHQPYAVARGDLDRARFKTALAAWNHSPENQHFTRRDISSLKDAVKP